MRGMIHTSLGTSRRNATFVCSEMDIFFFYPFFFWSTDLCAYSLDIHWCETSMYSDIMILCYIKVH